MTNEKKQYLDRERIKYFLEIISGSKEATWESLSLAKIKSSLESAESGIRRALEIIESDEDDDKLFDEVDALCFCFAEIEVQSNEIFNKLETLIGMRGEQDD